MASLKPVTRVDRIRSSVHAATGRAKNKAGNAYYNRTAKPGTRTAGGGQYGRKTAEQKESLSDFRHANLAAVGIGSLLGTGIGGMMGGDLSGQHARIKNNKATIRRNQKKIDAFGKKLGGPTVHRITDLGTGAGRAEEKIYRGVHPGLWGAGAMGVTGVAAGTLTGRAGVKNRREIKTQKATIKQQRGQLRALNQGKVNKSMSASAFGVDHGGEISKADNKQPSAGRYATAALAGPFHGLAAGKKGKKLRAAGNQLGYGVGGGVAGSVVGGALSRGKISAIKFGNQAGSTGGVLYGTKRAQEKGYFKRQK